MTDTTPGASQELVLIPIEKLDPNKWNKKRELDPDFKASIAAQGVLVPILVRRVGQVFEIVAGERRYQAAKAAGLKEIPAVVRELTNTEARFCTAIENSQRKDMTAYQEAAILEEASKLEGFTISAAAAALGWSEIRVRRRLKLLNLIPEYRETAAEEGWSVDMAEALAIYPQEVQKSFLQSSARYRIDNAKSLKQLQIVLGDMRHTLRLASFDINDATLVPKCGACTSCPFRSGVDADLFGDAEGKPSKDDKCLKPDCWDSKVEALRVRKLAEAKAKHGKVIEVGTEKYKYYGDSVLSGNQYKRAKEGAKGAIAALVRDGSKPNEVIFVIPEGSSAAAKKVAEKAKGPTPMKEKREGLEVRRWCFVAEEVLKELKKREKDPKKLTLPELAALAAVFGVTHYASYGTENKGWASYHVLKLKAGEKHLIAYLWKLVSDRLATNLRGRLNSRSGAPKKIEPEVREVCGVMGLDVKILKERADKEIPEPKSWASAPAAAPKKATPKAAKKGKK